VYWIKTRVVISIEVKMTDTLIKLKTYKEIKKKKVKRFSMGHMLSDFNPAHLASIKVTYGGQKRALPGLDKQHCPPATLQLP
jgi:hypothetical protein